MILKFNILLQMEQLKKINDFKICFKLDSFPNIYFNNFHFFSKYYNLFRMPVHVQFQNIFTS